MLINTISCLNETVKSGKLRARLELQPGLVPAKLGDSRYVNLVENSFIVMKVA